MMTCIECREQLGEYAEGKLSQAVAQTVAQHLEGCPDCREELDGLRLALSAMRSLEPVEPPQWLLGAISEAVDRAQPGRRAWRWSWQQAGGLALAACVLVGFVVVLRPGMRPAAPGAPAVPTASLPTAPAVADSPGQGAATATTPAPVVAAVPATPEPDSARGSVPQRPTRATAARPRETSHGTRPQADSRNLPRTSHPAVTPLPAGPPGPQPGLASRVASLGSKGPAGSDLANLVPGPADMAVAERMGGGPGEPKMAWLPDDAGAATGRGPTEPRPGAAMMTFGVGAPGAGGPGGPALCGLWSGGAEPGQGMDVQFIPPRERLVGQEAVALLALRPTRAMSTVEVRVEPTRGMKVANADDGGVVFDAPMGEGRRVTVPLRLVAQEEGRQELKVVVQTDPPDGNTQLEVAMPGFAAAGPEASELDARLRRSVSLRVLDGEVRGALQSVGQEAGIAVDVSPSVGDARVNVDLQDVPAEAALRLLCQDAQLRMHREGEGVRVYRP